MTSNISSLHKTTPIFFRFLTLSFLCLLASQYIFAQNKTRIDTTYYDRDWNVVPEKAFADYYLIALYPYNPSAKRLFRVFLVDGKLKTRGGFIYLDPTDEGKNIYDGVVEKFYANGNVEQRMNYDHGKLNGQCMEYFENGLIRIASNYKNDLLDGPKTVFNEDGSYTIDEYIYGQHVNSYYIYGSTRGVELKIDRESKKVLWENAQNEIEEVFRDGRRWLLHHQNGITVALSIEEALEYGEWYKVEAIITNDSPFTIEFDPSDRVWAYSYGKGSENPTNLPVWSANEYTSLVKRKQEQEVALAALGEGLAAASAGYSNTASSGIISYNGNIASLSTVSATYDSFANYQASVMARQRIENFNTSQWLQRQSLYKNYLKKNTVRPYESIRGFFNIAKKKGKTYYLHLNVDIEGALYSYSWELNKKEDSKAFKDWNKYADEKLVQIEEAIHQNKKTKVFLLLTFFNDWYQRGTYEVPHIEERLDVIYKAMNMTRTKIDRKVRIRDSNFEDSIYTPR